MMCNLNILLEYKNEKTNFETRTRNSAYYKGYLSQPQCECFPTATYYIWLPINLKKIDYKIKLLM